jgi:hypothetical protein
VSFPKSIFIYYSFCMSSYVLILKIIDVQNICKWRCSYGTHQNKKHQCCYSERFNNDVQSVCFIGDCFSQFKSPVSTLLIIFKRTLLFGWAQMVTEFFSFIISFKVSSSISGKISTLISGRTRIANHRKFACWFTIFSISEPLLVSLLRSNVVSMIEFMAIFTSFY